MSKKYEMVKSAPVVNQKVCHTRLQVVCEAEELAVTQLFLWKTSCFGDISLETAIKFMFQTKVTSEEECKKSHYVEQVWWETRLYCAEIEL